MLGSSSASWLRRKSLSADLIVISGGLLSGLIQNDRLVFGVSAGDIELEEGVDLQRGSLFTACKEI